MSRGHPRPFRLLAIPAACAMEGSMIAHPYAGAIGLAVLGFTVTVRAADTAPITLRWTAPAGCPAQEEIRQEIDRLLGGPRDPASPRHLRAEAVVMHTRDGGFRVHITTDMAGSIGEQEFDAPSCAALAEAAALIVAFTFDPEAVTKRSAEPVAAAPPLPPSPTAATPAVPPVPLPTSSSRAPLSPPPVRPLVPLPVPPPRADASRSLSRAPTFVLSAATAISAGALPSIGIGIGGGAGLLLGRLRADVSAAYWPNRRSAVTTRPTAGGDVSLFAVDARACYVALLAPIEIAPCAGLSIGRMVADGFGVKSPGTGAALWIAPLVEASTALPIGRRFALRIDLGALAPVRRPTFVLERIGSVHRASAFVGLAVLAAEARF